MAFDIELAELITKMATDARIQIKEEIPRFLAARNITQLFHFTSISNLESIIAHGLMGKETLEKEKITYSVSDQFRAEPILDGVCLSLSRPNHYMASKKIELGHELVLLELRGLDTLLSEFNYISVPGNFGSSILKEKLIQWPEEFIGSKGLLNLFLADEVRSKYKIPQHEPTDLQSEIIFFDPIPRGFIKKIYFPNILKNAVEEKVRKIIQILPPETLLTRHLRDYFPSINWNDKEIALQYMERRWKENWI